MKTPLYGLLAAVALLAGCASAPAPAAGVDLGSKPGEATTCTKADGTTCTTTDGKTCTPADGQGCAPDAGGAAPAGGT